MSRLTSQRLAVMAAEVGGYADEIASNIDVESFEGERQIVVHFRDAINKLELLVGRQRIEEVKRGQL